MFRKIAGVFLLIAVLVVAGISPAAADDVGPVEPLTPAPSAETGEMTDENSQSLVRGTVQPAHRRWWK